MQFTNDDIYAEWLVKKKDSPYLILYYIGGGLLLLAAFAVMCFWSWGFVIFIPAAFAAYAGRRYAHLEYEYAVVSSELTIDRIFSQSSRKTAITIDMHDVHSVEKTDRVHLQSLVRESDAAFMDFTSGEADAQIWLISCTHQKKGELLLAFEPNDRVLQAMWKSAPSKVKI